jgi:hypothetical protein
MAKYRELIDLGLARGRHAKSIWRDLVDDHGFVGAYASVKRFVHDLDAFFQGLMHRGELQSEAVRQGSLRWPSARTRSICFATTVKLAMIRCQEEILRPPGQVSPHAGAPTRSNREGLQ